MLAKMKCSATLLHSISAIIGFFHSADIMILFRKLKFPIRLKAFKKIPRIGFG